MSNLAEREIPTLAAHSAASSETQQFLTFTVGQEEYGVDIMMIREVKGWSDTTRLPNSPTYVRGVLNLRGIIIPIFDLRARFSGELTQATEKHVVVIIAVGNRIMGLLVDTVSDILTVAQSDIKPAPENNGGMEAMFVSGLIAVEGRMVVLLDIAVLLSRDEHLADSARSLKA
ncbi:MAG: purine-binding chemotaxis protein CheW [Proteobacteria bacterium]|nr:purine-binding chemotaxis protein CheW [Pseudomonadota bacterium]